jgi:hypothetical protein
MSGVAEASAIFGLVTGSIDVIKLAIEIYEAAKGGAPRRIEKVAEQLPSIRELLENARDTKNEHDDIWKTVELDVNACEKACKALKAIFDRAFPEESSGKMHRAWTASAVIFTGKRSEADDQLAAIYKSLAMLKGKLIITNALLLEKLKTAVETLGGDESGIDHSGSGDNVVNNRDGTFNYTKGDNNKIIGSIGTYHEPVQPRFGS